MTTAAPAKTLKRHYLSSPFGNASVSDYSNLLNSMRTLGYLKSQPIWLYEAQIFSMAGTATGQPTRSV